jgi:tetraacyldisaccharide 4'-kinase
VVVVGNLSVGGTGKTPLTIWLVEFLRNAGFRPGVVSRGYGGRSGRDHPRPVLPDTDPAAAGDEPVLIARRTKAPVMVCTDRVHAAQALLEQHRCDLIIADDGLQHYRLGRDIEILLIDGERRFGNGRCLPAGPLREPPDRVATVDFVIRRGGEPEAGEYAMKVEGASALNLVSGQRRPLAEFTGERLRAVAGIANPERFFRHLAGFGLTVEAMPFPDHHAYTAEDLAIESACALLMTEKDAVKCRRFADLRHWCVPIDARLQPAFGPALLQRLRPENHG